MNQRLAPQISAADTCETPAPGVLSPEQGSARTAFNNFCWNLTFAIGRSPFDTGLSKAQRAEILSILAKSDEEVSSEGRSLYEAWIHTGGNDIAPAVFTVENMEYMLLRANVAREQYRVGQEFRANMRPIAETRPHAGVAEESPI